MNVQRILINDSNPEHRKLSIYRTGIINRVRLQDKTYTIYHSLDIDAHNYAALFHYGLVESLNKLPFLSETSNGLDSWDEAFLHNSSLESMKSIVDECLAAINPEKKDIILLGWHDEPLRVAYLREIEHAKFFTFIDTLRQFVEESRAEGCDLEFIL
ncbi:MAG: hypothetical protein WCG19_08600 [Chlorobiaceae bacterium]